MAGDTISLPPVDESKIGIVMPAHVYMMSQAEGSLVALHSNQSQKYRSWFNPKLS